MKAELDAGQAAPKSDSAARMTYDSEAQAIYVYAIEGYQGPIQTTSLYEDEFMVNVDRKPDGTMVGIEIVGVRLEDITDRSDEARIEAAADRYEGADWSRFREIGHELGHNGP